MARPRIAFINMHGLSLPCLNGPADSHFLIQPGRPAVPAVSKRSGRPIISAASKQTGRCIAAAVSRACILAGIFLLLSAPAAPAAQVIPSSGNTVTLQTTYPGQSEFLLPLGNSIIAGGSGVQSDNSQDWVFTNQGTLSAGSASKGSGLKLGSATAGAAVVFNEGTIRSTWNGSSGPSGVQFTNGGQVYNRAGGVIEGFDGVHTDGGSMIVENAGTIHGNRGGGTAIYSGQGLSVTNLTGGLITGDGYGISANSPHRSAIVRNYGEINTSGQALKFYAGDTYAVYNAPGGVITSGGGSTVDLRGSRGYLVNEGTITASNTALHADNSGGGNVYVNAGVMTAGNGYGIHLAATDSGNTIYSLGTLTGTSGAVRIEGNDTRLVLGKTAFLPQLNRSVTGPGSDLGGDAVSLGSNNTLLLTDSGSEDSALTGFASLTMRGVAWTLDAPLALTRALIVEQGNLSLTDGLTFSSAAPVLAVLNNGSVSVGGAGNLNLGAGVLSINLLRSKSLAAVSMTGGGTLETTGAFLRLRRTGLLSEIGSWLLVDGAYSGPFVTSSISTARVQGSVRYDPGKIWFDGAFVVPDFPDIPDIPPRPDLSAFYALPPNARRAWPGFRDAFFKNPTPFMETLDLAYPSPAAFAADLPEILRHAHPEGAVSQGLQALSAHSAAATTALAYAFPYDAPVSRDSFMPAQGLFNQGSGGPALPGSEAQARREQSLAQARYADRPAALDGNLGHASSAHSLLDNWRPASEQTLSILRNDAGQSLPLIPALAANDGSASPNTPFGIRLWGGYFGDFARQGGQGGYVGYDAEHNGFLLGGSFALNPQWTAGGYVGWTTGETRYNDIDTRIDTDATHLGAFIRYRQKKDGGFLLTGDIIHSFTKNDSSREATTILGRSRMEGSFDQQVRGAGLEIAYAWSPQVDPATVVTPFLAGRYANLNQDGYSEDGDLALDVGDTNADSFTSSMGLTVARDFRPDDALVLTPRVTAGWLHQWADDNIDARSNFIGSPVTFMTRSVEQDRDALLLGAGLDALVKTGSGWNLGLKLGYGADLRENSNDQTVFGGIEVRF